MKLVKAAVYVVLMTLAFSKTAVASEYGYKLEKLECAEWDPFLLGDRCFMSLYGDDRRLVLDLDFDAFNEIFGGEDESYFANKVIIIDSINLEKVSRKITRAIREYVPKGFEKAPVRTIDPSLIVVAPID
jgi:hypothetical protein